MELNEQNKQMSKTEPETWKQGTNQREGRREKMGERRGRLLSKNMYKGHMVMDNRVGIDWGCGRVGGAGESNGGKIGITVIEQQFKKRPFFFSILTVIFLGAPSCWYCWFLESGRCYVLPLLLSHQAWCAVFLICTIFKYYTHSLMLFLVSI